jgi:hypothetical protein
MPQRQIHDPTNKLQIRDLNEMFRELYAAIKKLLPLTGGVLNGPIIIPEKVDVTLTSEGHPLQLGVSSGLNIAMDSNEIQARNNGSVATLELNALGGEVRINGYIAHHTGNHVKFVNDISQLGLSGTPTLLTICSAISAPCIAWIDSGQIASASKPTTDIGLCIIESYSNNRTIIRFHRASNATAADCFWITHYRAAENVVLGWRKVTCTVV